MFLLIILPLLASFYVGWRFKQRFTQYSKVALQSGESGAEIAQRMLAEQGVAGVNVLESRQGGLSDHYNPADRTVNLSAEVYHGRSVAAAAVAAHECGHAVQHAKMYAPLQFRSAIVPAVSIASRFMPFLLMGGVLTLSVFPQLLMIGVAMFALTTLFSFITLPVEFDASRRALAWLQTSGISQGEEQGQMKTALWWAAMTYVVAALASLGTLIYYLMLLRSRD